VLEYMEEMKSVMDCMPHAIGLTPFSLILFVISVGLLACLICEYR
jgi:hypothetical protein